jgi:hypothetical protein
VEFYDSRFAGHPQLDTRSRLNTLGPTEYVEGRWSTGGP